LREEDGFRLNAAKLKRAMEGCKAIYIANPSNPAGVLAEKKNSLM
jgi:aspartate/methionine/tyrosine aminotransferase